MPKTAIDAVACLDYVMTLSIATFNTIMVRLKPQECSHSESNGCNIKFWMINANLC
jgi:hypothetical protein